MAKDPFDDLQPASTVSQVDPFDEIAQQPTAAPALGLRAKPEQASALDKEEKSLEMRGLGLTPESRAALIQRGKEYRESPTAFEEAGAGALSGTLGLAESLYRTPEAVRRWAGGTSSAIEDVTGLPRALNPVRAIESTAEFLSSGQIPGTAIRRGGASDIAERISGGQKFLAENVAPFKENAQAAQRADAALKQALEGDFSGVAKVATDPKAMAGFLGQAAPSLVASYVSGGSLPFMAWMEAMEVSSNAAEFEQRTGQKINDRDFMQAQAQAGLVNGMLERIVPDALLKGDAGKSALNIVLTGLKEAGTEGLQAFNTNLAEMLAFNREKDLAEGVLPSALGGLGAGSGAGAAQYAATRGKAKEAQQIDTAEQATEQPIVTATELGAEHARQNPQRAAILREIAKAEADIASATDDAQITAAEDRLSTLYGQLEAQQKDVGVPPATQATDPFDALVAEQNAARQAEIDVAMPKEVAPRFGLSRMRAETPQAQAVGAKTQPLIDVEPYNVREATRDIAISKTEKALGDVKIPEGLEDARIKRLPYRQHLQQVAAAPLPDQDSTTINPVVDELLDAIAKAGGLSIEEARAQGIDPEHFKDRPGRRNPFRQGGKSFDSMAETLGQYGYFGADQYTANGLLDKVASSLSGSPIHSANADPQVIRVQSALSVDPSLTPWQVQDAVKKAVNGERLGVRQARAVGAVMDSLGMERAENVDYARKQLEAARSDRRAIRQGFGPLSAYEQDMDAMAGEYYNEEAYAPEWDGPTRSMSELATEAHKVDSARTESAIGSNRSDTDVARELLAIINEGQRNEQEQGRPQGDIGEASGIQRVRQVPTEATEARGAQENKVAAQGPLSVVTMPNGSVSVKGDKDAIYKRLQANGVTAKGIPSSLGIVFGKRHASDVTRAIEAQQAQETKAVETEARGERRIKDKARKLYEAMSKDDLIKELLHHELTGIKGRRAFVVEVEDAENIIAVDADSLKWVNDNMSPASGDKLLMVTAEALQREFGYDRAYHTSGDEFYVLLEPGDDLAEAKKAMERVEQAVKETTISIERLDGTKITVTGITATPGYGKTKEEADYDLKQEKPRREAAGQRAGRGEQPAGAIITAPEGQQGAEVQPAAAEGADVRREDGEEVAAQPSKPSESGEPAADEAKATEILDRANVTGKERLDIMRDFREGKNTLADLGAAYPAKTDELASESISPAETDKSVSVSQPVETETQQVAPKGKMANILQDAGEELWYNRRNLMRNGIQWDDIAGLNDTLKLKEATKAKVWPKMDYEALVDAGMNPLTAHFIKQAYDAIPTKPNGISDEQIKAYVEAVNGAREKVIAWAKDSDAQARLAEWIGNAASARLGRGGSILIDMASGQSRVPTDLIDSIFPLGNGVERRFRFRDSNPLYDKLKSVALGNKFIRAIQYDMDSAVDAMKAIDKGWPKPQEAWQRQGYSVAETSKMLRSYYSGENSKGRPYTYLHLEGGKQRVSVLFADKTEAAAFADALKPWLALSKRGEIIASTDTREEAVQALREATKREGKGGDIESFDLAMAVREGVERRQPGEDVDAQRLIDVFGFRGVNYGNWVNGAERQAFTNQAYDAMLDLADLMGIPPKAISLNGMLGLAFGAQGRGGTHTAHFVPGVNEINLTKTAGAGALAHEWAHAIDHYFATLAGKAKASDPFATHLPERELSELRPEVRSAFKSVVDAMRGREETPAETAERIKRAKEQDGKSLERWIEYFRKQLEAGAKPEAKEKALADFDSLAERMRKGDLGDGYVNISGRKGRQAELTGSVREAPAAVRDLYKEAVGRVPSIDDVKSLDAAAGTVKFAKSADGHALRHKPQQVKTDYYRKARGLDADKGGQKAYWSEPTEMFARAFQSWAIDRLRDQAARNDFLSRPQPGPDAEGAIAAEIRQRYPQGDERNTINKAIDTLVGAIETKETDQGVALFSRQPQFFSQLQRSIESAPDKVFGKAAQFKLWLQSNSAKMGIKKDELQWSGILDYLDMRKSEKVTKEDVTAFLDENGVQVKDVMKAGDITEFSKYTPPGSIEGSYRETLVTLPRMDEPSAADRQRMDEIRDKPTALTEDEKDEYERLRKKGVIFESTHFNEPNILVHLRTDEVIGTDGKRYLRVIEVQSDWGQKGKKKGFVEKKPKQERLNDLTQAMYGVDFANATAEQQRWAENMEPHHKDGGTMAAPFVTDTRAWVALGIKRAIMHAVNSGVDGVVFATGQQNADLYDLSKQVQSISYMKVGNEYRVTADRLDNGGGIDLGTNTEAELEDKVGKDVAEKIVNGEGVKSGDMTILRGLDLKVGGEGMRAFYDQIVPSVANDVLKKIGGGKVEQIGDNKGFAITDAMREQVQTVGLPLFARKQDKKKGGVSIQKAEAQKLLDAITAKLPGSPKVNVIANMDDAPEKMRKLDETQRSQGAYDIDPEGFYYNGQAYIVLSGVYPRAGETEQQAIFRVFAHEVLGHAGLRGAFGAQLHPILREVSIKRRKDVIRKAKQYGLSHNLESAIAAVNKQAGKNGISLTQEQIENNAREMLRDDLLVAAEEVLAEMAQSVPTNNIVVRAVEAIRKALKALYIKLPANVKNALGGNEFVKWVNSMTDAEIIDRFIVPARRYVETNKTVEEQGAGSMPVVFKRTEQLSEGEGPAFSRQQPVEQDKERPPEETAFQKQQRIHQDKFIRFRVIQDWLNERGIQLSEKADVYRAEERYHGRVATRTEDFREKTLNPLIKSIQKAGFTLEQVEEFLHAQHAEERNKQVARVNPEMPDGGSGMTTADANTILSKAPPELRKVANEYRAITDKTRDMLHKAGILSDEQVAAWKSAYRNYVPLKGGDEVIAGGTGKGLTAKNKQKRALGHKARDEMILENIQRDHERAIILVEKNRVGQHLLKLALEAGHPDLITIDKPKKRAVLRDNKSYEVSYNGSTVASFNSFEAARAFVGIESMKAGRTGTEFSISISSDPSVAYMASPMLGPNETQVYVDGHSVRVQFNDELLGRAYNNMGVEHLNAMFMAGRQINTFLSKMYTGYSVDFIFTNAIRDWTSGIINLTGQEGLALASKAAKNYPKAASLLAKYAATGEEPEIVKQYRADGGTTGAAYLSDLERLGHEARTAYDQAAGLLENVRAGKPVRGLALSGEKAVVSIFKPIERLNMVFENAMRLSAYMSAIDSGMSREKAASIAKNATVNFNRKGELGQQINSLYLFHNASVQGSAIILHSLFKGKHRHQAQALAAGLISIGYLMALTMGGGDDDEYEKLPEYVKERNLTFKTGDGWVTIPIPYGYGFFVTAGRKAAEVQTGKTDATKASVQVAANMISELTVFGNAIKPEDPDARDILFLAPTLAQIIGAPISNRTGLGIPVHPESYNKEKPDSQIMYRNTIGTYWDKMASGLNKETGGDEVRKGWLDVSPETLKYIWNTATGGTGRGITDIANVAKLKAEGADAELRETPIARRFVREETVSDARSRFWKYANEAKAAESRFQLSRKAANREIATDILKNESYLIQLARMSEAYRKAANAKRDAIDEVRANEEMTLSERRAAIKKIEAEEAELYDQYVERHKRAVEERKKEQDQRS